MQRIHDAFLPWVASHAARIALSDAGSAILYGELPAALDALADRLRTAGVRAGDRVLLVAENSVAQALCILALSRLDAWSVSVNARCSNREIDNFLQHSGARLALYFHLGSEPAQRHGLEHAAQTQDWPVIGAIMLGPLNPDANAEPVAPAAAQQVAVMVYTSGTTGAPKAVMLTHENLLFIANNSRQLRALTPADTVYGVLPLSHVYGLSSLLIASLISGAGLRLVARFVAADLAHSLVADGITVLHGAPAMYAKLLAWGKQPGKHLRAPDLRIAQSGGAALTLPLKHSFEQTFGLPLHNGYGMSEAAPSICQTRIDAPRQDCSVGQPIPGIQIRIEGAELNADGIGELYLRGPNVMKGYYRAPELSALSINPQGWLRSGDLARVADDGAVFIVGRNKDVINRSGFNVYPLEVEQVLNAYPGVLQSAVLGRSVHENEEVIAFIELEPDRKIDTTALAEYLRSHLAAYKLPAQIIILDQLPAAANGKVLRHELSQRAAKLATPPIDNDESSSKASP
jgi:acyl-CoA synthetase (AMP-forming)/AMP-acid ligase II